MKSKDTDSFDDAKAVFIQKIGINQLTDQLCAVESRSRLLLKAFCGLDGMALEPKAVELSRSAQHRQRNPPYSVEMFSVTQSTRLRTLQVILDH
jgi:hypothetical protein